MMDGKELRIVFMGTPDFAVASLRALVEGGYNVVGVVTMPDKPSGRGLKLNESAVKRYAVSVGLNLLQPEKLKDEAFVEQFRALNADLGIVIAFRMLPEVVWSAPRLGTFNLHASLLPQYRGAAPINWAIINGERESGVTTFMLNHQIDKGDVLFRRSVDIDPKESAGTLHDKLMFIGRDLVVDSVEKIAAGDVVPMPQIDADELKPAPKIFKEDCKIDWSWSVERIDRHVRGLSPYPAAWSDIEINGEPSTAKILSVAPCVEDHDRHIGFTDVSSSIKIYVNGGYVELLTLQPAGKRAMSAGEFLRGLRGELQFR